VWSASRFGQASYRAKGVCTHTTGGLMGPRSGLGTVEKNSDCPTVSPKSSSYSLGRGPYSDQTPTYYTHFDAYQSEQFRHI
jgi:hypothetical protein